MCPYDAELFGHWWYEGPYWLYVLFKKIYYNNTNFKLITPSEYVKKYPVIQECTPCRCSWGANGYSEVWLNGSNDYALKHIHHLAEKMVELAHTYYNETDKLKLRVLNQCAREVLLAQSSDWLFIITNGTMVDYAKKRIKEHVGRFNRFCDELNSGNIDEKFLTYVEKQDCVFDDIDFRIYF